MKIKRDTLKSEELLVPAIIIPTKDKTFVVFITNNNEVFTTDSEKYFTSLKNKNNKIDYILKEVVGFKIPSEIIDYGLYGEVKENHIFNITTKEKIYYLSLDLNNLVKI